MSAASIFTIATAMALAWYTSSRVRAGLTVLESAISHDVHSPALNTGFAEFDDAAIRLGMNAARWESISADTRQQSSDFISLMKALNRRDPGGEPSSVQIRELLAGLGNTLYTHLKEYDRTTVEVQESGQTIADGAEAQAHVVSRTTACVEQLASAIDSVSANIVAARNAVQSNHESASAALGLVGELNESMSRVRNVSQSCEKKLRGLCDPSQQISAIVATISDIAAKTNLLALNASIESIRAGEHGSGFAIVAEEVRQLAEQATDATREITSLIESMQVVTQESIRGVELEREEVESATDRANAVKAALQSIYDVFERDSAQLIEIAKSSGQQLELTHDIVLAIERISKIAKTNRGEAEKIGWTMNSLSKANPQISSAIDRLRGCAADRQGQREQKSNQSSSVAPVVTPPSNSILTPIG